MNPIFGEVVVVFRNYRNLFSRLALIVALLAGIYGALPMQASAKTASAPPFESQECNSDEGWMWATGPSDPDVAAQVQKELSQQGIAAHVEAKSYGEIDGCNTYHRHGIDFTIKLVEKEAKQASSQPEFADRLLPILTKHGKPGLGNVTLLSDEGEIIPSSLENTHSISNEIQMDALTTGSLAVASPATETFTKKVYVIVYDPLLSTGQKLSQYMGWNDYAVINQQTIDLFKRASNNRMNYVVVDTTIKSDGWPELIDGFTYTEQEYLNVVFGRQSPHKPMDANYNKIVSLPEFDICGKVNRGEIDEVWIYNGPYFGFYESTLVGPGGYKYNSFPILNTSCNRLIPIMGPSVERTISEATHNFVHRTEATMTRVYGSWEENRTDHGWDKFALVKLQSPSYTYSGCGSAHWPPNAVAAEYDYSNSSGTLSNCNDFFNYPNLGDPLQVSQLVTCSTWGCTGHGYNEYWFNHMPSSLGCDSDNVANDWWIYFANPAAALSPSSSCTSNVHRISGNTTVAGATLSYTDGIPKTTMANIFGDYSLVVSDHWSGTITPLKAGHTFSPASRSYADVVVNQINQDYASQGGTVSKYYVNIATGNNSNPCTTATAPCRDIQETLNKANPGAIIHVANGRYLFSTNPSPNVLIINKHIKLSGGWSADFASQNGASIIDGANVNNGILVLSGTVVVENFIVENSTSSNSGAIYIVDGNLTLKQSTLRNNFATSNGAGIFVDNGTVTVINSTISGNRANGSGGGIFAALNSDTSVSLINSTVAYNQGSWGGGISQIDGTFTLANSIVANNSSYVSSPDCQGTVTANFSLIENTAGCTISSGGNNLNLDPQLDSNLTGSILVHQPLAGSPVIDAGSLSECQAIDQRGIIRPQGRECDIGAVEYRAPVSPDETIRVSVALNGELTNGPSGSPSISADGRYIAFASSASNLVSGDTNERADIFTYDLQTGVTRRVSLGSNGMEGDNDSGNPSISGNGRYIAFSSLATNLVPSDTNGRYDIFVHDLQTGLTERVSVDSSGGQLDRDANKPSISADGYYVAFETYESDIWIHNMQTGVTSRVSIDPTGGQPDRASHNVSLSADARYVTFDSDATNLVLGDTNQSPDVFVRDMQTATTIRVSLNSSGAQAGGGSHPAISADGHYVAYESYASDLVPGDTNWTSDIFVHDIQAGTTARISVDSSGAQADAPSFSPVVSADGRYVTFVSAATNLVPGDTNGAPDVFVHDTQTHRTTRVSVGSNGTQANSLWSPWKASISADGQYVAFDSDATNLVVGDTAEQDVFVHHQAIVSTLPTPTYTLTSIPTFTPTATQTPTKTNTPTPTITATLPRANNGLYLSLTGSQTIGGVASSDEDILRFDGTSWSLFFDGSDVGVGSPDLFAFSMVDGDTLLMSFSASVTVQGIAATPQDVLRFDATSLGGTTSGTWSLYFDGSDVGLETTAEKIDSVSVLPDGRLLLSTTGNPAVPGLSGLADEDVLAFSPTSLGHTTSGTWSMYFDGSDVGLSTSSGEDIDALDITSNGDIYLSTLDNFSVAGVSGADEDVFVCTPLSLGSNTTCTFSSTLYFDGSSWGLSSNDVDAIHVLTTGSVPPSTPTPTGTPGSPTTTFTPTATHTVTATGTVIVPPTATHTPPPTLSNPPTPTGTPGSSDVIFTDGFESGNLSAWSASSTDAGDLSANPAAALVGSEGMQAVIDDANVLSVTSDHPNVEPHYLARFYFDPNSISMASGDSHIILRGYSGSSTIVLRVEFGYGASGYQLRAGLLNDGSTWTETSWFPLSDAPHAIQLDWRAASSSGANDGGLVLWIDGVQKQMLTGIDNDTRRMERVLLGALASIDTGTRGTYYFDAFESQR